MSCVRGERERASCTRFGVGVLVGALQLRCELHAGVGIGTGVHACVCVCVCVCEIIDLRTVRPLDIESILTSVRKTNRLVILEEAWPFGNVSTEITYQVQNEVFDYLDAPIEKINTADTPAPFSPVLLNEWLPNSEDVIAAVKKVVYFKK